MPTATVAIPSSLTAEQLESYDRAGYLILRGLIGPGEVAAIAKLFDDFAAAGVAVKGYWEPSGGKVDADVKADPLQRYPRVMQPHRWMELAKQYLLDQRIHDVLAGLLGEKPIAAQTMYYYKPPGARGQALHQDNFYLEVKPGSCIAAWIAIDPATEENGGLIVVPGTHRMDVACPEAADTRESFSGHLVKPPAGTKLVPAVMAPGDVLFFNGSLIHGSKPNSHPTLWRRSLINHYLPAGSKQIAKWYPPLLDFAGNVVGYPVSQGGGPCGSEVKPISYNSNAKWH